MTPDINAYQQDGFIGPIPVFEPRECANLFRLLTSSGKAFHQKGWGKGLGAKDPAIFKAATDTRLLDLIVPILGPDVILWGVRPVIKKIGQVHAFHTDIEASSPNGRFASIWVGLNNTGRKSGLKFVRGSHLFGKAVQQLESENDRRNVDDDTIMNWAKQFTSAPELMQPEVKDGTALLFDGRVWHGSHNEEGDYERTALLVQYAAGDQPVYIPTNFDIWPPEFDRKRRPPVVVVAGAAAPGVNLVVEKPLHHRLERLGNSVHALPAQTASGKKAFSSVKHFEGETEVSDYIECHTSILAPGAIAHPLHWHEEEELLLVVAGEASLHIADNAEGKNEVIEVLHSGDFVYYPAFKHHTIENRGMRPVQYTMLKWRNNSPKDGFDLAPSARIFRTGSELHDVAVESRFYKRVFEEPTHWLVKVHAHLSVMPAGTGYQSHADNYDVCIVLLSGSIESLGAKIAAPAVLFHPAGALHGLKSVGETEARYIVFEFHGLSREDVRKSFAKPKTIKGSKKVKSAIKKFLRRIVGKG